MQFKTLQSGLFILLLILATALFGWLVGAYFQPIFWSVVLAILFYPVYKKIKRRVHQDSISSVLTIGLIILVVVTPIYFLGVLIANEAISLYSLLTASDISSSSLLQQMRIVLLPFEQFGVDVTALEGHILTFIQNISVQVGTYALDIGKATASTVIGVFLSLYILFFALRDGSFILTRVQKALPLGGDKEEMLFKRFVSIVHAMFKGTFIIALIQGLIGGILFAVVGLPSAALWAFVMAFLALIPAVGPALVWLPAGVLLLFSGAVWQGVTVLIVGVAIISLVDNILRPILSGKDAGMPDVLMLLSVLGGLGIFGIAGIIIGPVITAFFLSMWELFEHDYARQLKKHG